MPAISPRNEAGFTLVEMMVSMLILVVCLLGLLKALNVAIFNNTRNLIRADVVRVAEDTMNMMKTQPITATFTPFTTVTRNIRGISKQYKVRRTATALPSSAVSYQVSVKWAFQNLTATHTIVSVRGNQ